MLFITLAEDPSYSIRTKLFELHLKVVSHMSAKLLHDNWPFLTEIFPYWLILMYDPEKSVRDAARTSFSFLSASKDVRSVNIEIEDGFPFEKDSELMLKLFGSSEESLLRMFSCVFDQLKSIVANSKFQIEDPLLERNTCSILQLGCLMQTKFCTFSNISELFSGFLDRSCIAYLTDSRTKGGLYKCFCQYVASLLKSCKSTLVPDESLIFICKLILIRANKDDYVESFPILNSWTLIEKNPKLVAESSKIVHDWLCSKWQILPSFSILRMIPKFVYAFCTDLKWWALLVSSLSKCNIFSESQQREVALCLADCQNKFLLLCGKKVFAEAEVESDIINLFLSNLLSAKVCNFVCAGFIITVLLAMFPFNLLGSVPRNNVFVNICGFHQRSYPSI